VRTSSQEADLNRKFAMASYSGASGGSQGSNESLAELRGLRSDLRNLNVSMTNTRSLQLGIQQDKRVQSYKTL
jgi:hypothetical protein